MNNTLRLRVALVGCGRIAQTHCGYLRQLPQVELVGACDVNAASRESFTSRWQLPSFADVDELLAAGQPHVVHVVTPPATHARLAIQLLDAGMHVLVEKPMAMTSVEADELLGLAKSKGRTLAVVSQRRFEDQHEAVKRVLDSGALGKLLLIEVSCPYYRDQAYYDSADWRGKIATDGGAIMNQGIHSVDLMLWFAGPARTVQGKIATQTHRMEAEDLALAIVAFESGAFGTIMASTSIQPGFTPCLNLYGEKGTIKLEGASIVHWTVPGVPKPDVGASPASAAVRGHLLSSHVMHQRQILDVLAAIEEQRPPRVSGDDGRRAVRLIEGLYLSSKNGGLVIL
ncbi:MAG TPA: Gfo/Idh/MocA family oxidoreductase [Planctomycetota bacterium]|nr:Gfo/Idh/MocA family oxidoreductase [Planctomycetota bacterium]